MEIKNYNVYFFMLILIGISILAFLLFKPFLTAILTAAILSAVFRRIYIFIWRKIKNKSVASLLTCLLVLFAIVLPVTIVFGLVANEMSSLYEKVVLDQNFYENNVNTIINNLRHSPVSYTLNLEGFFQGDTINQSLQKISIGILKIVQKTYQNVIMTIVWLFVMFFTLYYFLIESEKVVKKIMYLSPLRDEYENELSGKFSSMVRATLKSTVIVGSVQGFLASLMFAIAGIPSFIIWGVIMTILSIIPAIGSGLIWAPAGIIMLFTGHIWQGIFILLFGSFVISFIDNILRPKLVGNDTEMHPLLVFFATLGGLISFGILGFIIGPVIMALFLSLWEIYGKEFKDQLKKFNA